MSSSIIFSFYGKLPWTGDFIARNISFAQQQRIDAWISTGFSALNASNPEWLEAYLYAPVWNFMLPAGVWLDVPVMGAFMPSVDSVGRYFPFVFFSGIDEYSELSLYCSRFSQVANILPELLECELALDDVGRFIGNRLRQPTKDVYADEFSVMFESNMHDRIATGSSYWWRSDIGINIGFDCAPEPNEKLFLSLFNNYTLGSQTLHQS